MKKLKLVFVFAIFVVTTCLTLTSCEETSADVCSTDTAYENYIKALNSFSSNPTKSNCNNLKSKANSFIDAAERCGGIDASSAHNTINQIDCSSF